MKIYQILKSQYIVLIIFIAILWLVLIGGADDLYKTSVSSILLLVFLPFFLAFYIMGWKNIHKKNTYLYCPECGSKNNKECLYCDNCGKKFK